MRSEVVRTIVCVLVHGTRITTITHVIISALLLRMVSASVLICSSYFAGEKGMSSKTGRPLHYKGSFFHRIVNGSLVQVCPLLCSTGVNGRNVIA